MSKPKLNKAISIQDFKDNYWLKADLIVFCRTIGIKTTGAKMELADRIVRYLETGEVCIKSEKPRKKTRSTFDWNHEHLDFDTLISDNYRNTENVRAFFRKALGGHFKFNVEFMNWMKASSGKTLGDAVKKWQEIGAKKKDKNYRTEIAPQFEYNTYIRDFLEDNAQLRLQDAIECWKIKRERPERKKYNKSDLEFLKE